MFCVMRSLGYPWPRLPYRQADKPEAQGSLLTSSTPSIRCGLLGLRDTVPIQRITDSFCRATGSGLSPPMAGEDAVAFQARSRGVIKRSGALVPKRRAFAAAMTVKLRRLVGNDTPNIAQLGFYGDKGQWKVEVLPTDGA